VKMKKIYALACAALVFAGVPASAQQGTGEPARDAEGKITDEKHPDYILCRTESVIGSRAKKRRVCLTNREWARVAREGRGLASAMAEKNSSGLITN